MATYEEYNFYMRQLTGSNVICYFPQKSSKSWHENERSLKILTRILNIFKDFIFDKILKSLKGPEEDLGFFIDL